MTHYPYSEKQRELLELLAAHDGLVPIETLTVTLFGRHTVKNQSNVRTLISRVRDLLGDDAITTVRGVGYTLKATVGRCEHCAGAGYVVRRAP